MVLCKPCGDKAGQILAERIEKKLIKIKSKLKKRIKEWDEWKIGYDKIKNQKLKMCHDYELSQKLGIMQSLNDQINLLESIKNDL